jgi:hypothetical protein
MKKQYYMGQEVQFLTNLFGKFYFWMRDGDDTTYLVHAKQEDGNYVPDFSGLPSIS